MTKPLGVVASGHKETSKAARILLEEGGNAFDAALGAMCAACVSEPMLASLGGGGYLLAQTAAGDTQVFDFFTQTPSATAGELDFYPIQADFGTTTQEFHIGVGSIAVPGVVAGLFAVHQANCRLPLKKIIEPAVYLAREGLRINKLQSYINEILVAIINATPEARAFATPMFSPGRLAEIGEFIHNPDLADTFEALAGHGPRWFYEGEPAGQLVRDCEQKGGLISAADLRSYEVVLRKPITVESHGARISVNSPPSPGGCLIAFALSLLSKVQLAQYEWGGPQHALALASVMQASSLVRKRHGLESGLDDKTAATILSEENLSNWNKTLQTGGLATRGTTQISVVDATGNLASLTLSNGEGSSYVLPGSGIMMNNMLGEEDLNPGGFHRVPPGIRLASMMTPTIASLADGAQIALGSGGSNRIRSAILQVLTNVLEFDMSLEGAVNAPRLHLEHNHLSVETGFSSAALEGLEAEWPGMKHWPGTNLFFGGVHAVARLPNGEFRAAGDPRRGGAVAIAGFH
ncbi:MAG: gamma-glutamyltransferase [Xanthomonadales bacterium]|nr:gamma-glutamyltransferase [Xanthomonadales bacterium]